MQKFIFSFSWFFSLNVILTLVMFDQTKVHESEGVYFWGTRVSFFSQGRTHGISQEAVEYNQKFLKENASQMTDDRWDTDDLSLKEDTTGWRQRLERSLQLVHINTLDFCVLWMLEIWMINAEVRV